MKPLPGDHRHRLLITGDELRELKRHTGAMAEAFGLDRKIENYKGTRPITLYRWGKRSRAEGDMRTVMPRSRR